MQVVSLRARRRLLVVQPVRHAGRAVPSATTETATDDVEAPPWTAAALLLSFIWFVFAYPEFYPPTPHEVAVFLALYTAAVLAGAAYWGRSWVRHGEGFGALYGAIAQLGRTREPGAGPGLAPLLMVYLGGTLFDGISQTNWWIDVLGTSRGWTERAINTVGLAWSVAIVAVAYLAATRDRRGHRDPRSGRHGQALRAGAACPSASVGPWRTMSPRSSSTCRTSTRCCPTRSGRAGTCSARSITP